MTIRLKDLPRHIQDKISVENCTKVSKNTAKTPSNIIHKLNLEAKIAPYYEILKNYSSLMVYSKDFVQVVIPFLPNSKLNPNNTSSWAKKIKHKKEANILGQALMSYVKSKFEDATFNENKSHIECEIKFLTTKRLDDDNALSSLKHFRDGFYLVMGLDDSLQRKTCISMVNDDRNIVICGFKLLQNT